MQHIHGGRTYGKAVDLDFSVNLNPLGMPDSVKRCIAEHIEDYQTYPDTECTRLREKLSQVENVPFNRIVCGNGADGIIFRLGRVLQPTRALMLSPTFAEYERSLNCEVLYYPLMETHNFTILPNVLDYLQSVDVFYLCNPNNPTGALLDPNLMGAIVSKCVDNRITLVVDECFLDFVPNAKSFKEYLNVPNLNLIIIKAFTKTYSMAGIRLGYALTSTPQLCESISNCGQAWEVSTVAQVCGVSALNCVDYVPKTQAYVATERDYLVSNLNSLGAFKVYPSVANYVLVKSYLPFELYQAMLDSHILIRHCDNYHGLDGSYYRFAVKSHHENQTLIETLKKLLTSSQ